jgi:hypothetical protein
MRDENSRRSPRNKKARFHNFLICDFLLKVILSRCRWLIPIILATWEAEIRGIMV